MGEQVVEEHGHCNQTSEHLQGTLVNQGIEVDPQIGRKLHGDVTPVDACHVGAEVLTRGAIIALRRVIVEALDQAVTDVLPVYLIVLKELYVAGEIPGHCGGVSACIIGFFSSLHYLEVIEQEGESYYAKLFHS